MSTPLKKVTRDFGSQKLRTAIVVVSILVGVFAISGVGTMSATITNAFNALFSATHVSDITVVTSPTKAPLLSDLESIPNVTGAEARTVYQTRWRTDGSWHTISVVGVNSFTSTRVNQIPLKSGSYPRPGDILLEDSSRRVVSTKAGQTVTVQGQHGAQSLTVSGYGKDASTAPAFISGVSEGFMSESEVKKLSGLQGRNKFLLTIKTFDQKDATVKAVRAAFQKRKVQIMLLNVRDPNHFQVLDTFKTLTTLLTIFGIVALVLSGMLVINTMNTVVSEQTPQIGTMKAVGASARQIIRTYLTLGLLYGLCGTILGLVIGIIGAFGLVQVFAKQSDLTIPGLVVSPTSVIEGLAVGIAVTLVASLFPVWAGARITVREAISSYGIGTNYKPSRLDALVGTLPLLSRPARMSIRNIFRRQLRLILTLIPLVLAGGLFVAVGSLAISLTSAVNAVSSVNQADTVATLAQPGSTTKVAAAAQGVSGVAKVEAWYQLPVSVNGKDGMTLSGVPGDTSLYRGALTAGRRIRDSETNAVVVSDVYARDNHLALDKVLSIKAPSGTVRQWHLVGTVNDYTNNGAVAFAPRSQVQTLAGQTDRTNYLLIAATQHSHDALTGLMDRLGDALFPLGVQPSFTRVTDLNSQVKSQFSVFTVLFYVMVALVAIVGGLGLFAVLTMSVVERRKEIGVMRSIGAGSLDVIQVFGVEGLAIGLISFLISVVLSVPFAAGMTVLIGQLLIPISFLISPPYIGLMLLFMLAIAGISSIVPALSAARLRIAEVLRYG